MALFTPTTELLINGVWTSITSDVLQRDDISISRGRKDEASTVEASSCSITIDNRSLKYSPRNPTSPYYRLIGRNTPMRVRMATALENYMALPGGVTAHSGGWSGFATTPNAASLDIVGDIDIRVELEPETWRPPGSGYGLAQKATPLTPLDRSWRLWLDADGFLNFTWSPDATIAADITKKSTVAIPSSSTRLAVRVTLDVNNGSGGNTVAFSTSSTINGTYTALGSSVITAGTTVIDANAGQLDVGRVGLTWNDTSDPDVLLQGKVYRAQVRSGIAGSIVASPDFTLQDTEKTAFNDAQSRPWTLQGRATIANPGARFHGEVSAWPPRWGKPGRDVHVPIEGTGVLRRLGQGEAQKRSTLYQALTSAAGVVQYWPCEDGSESRELASALPGKPSMSQYGSPSNSSFDGFAASEPIPTIGSGHWVGTVSNYTNTDVIQASFLMAVPSGGAATTSLFRIRTTGGGSAVVPTPRWDIDLTTSGQLRLRAYDNLDVQVGDSGNLAFGVNGRLVRVTLKLQRIGSDIEWSLLTTEVGQTSSTSFGGTFTNRTMGRAVRVGVAVGTVTSAIDEVAIGQIAIMDRLTDDESLLEELNAFAGELATVRILRLCQDEGIPVIIEGDASDATLLGPQLPATLTELLHEAAAADDGVLYEPREILGLAYRTRSSLYVQDPALTLSYAAKTLMSIEPTEDDDATRNDITVTRINGSSHRAEESTGSLSVNPPPLGVGRYTDEVSLSLYRDQDTWDQATWRVHIGTVDEPRYPVLGIDLSSEAFLASVPLSTAAQAVGVGDRIVVTNPPSWLPPEEIQQIVQGATETIGQYHWLMDFNCAPASPYDVAVWDDSSGVGEARYSSDGTTITEDLTTTETGINISTPTGPVWSSTAVPYDIVIGGERMTVTAVSGVSAAQVFTVTRSVNGVVKTHATGATVELAKPGRYAL